MPIDWPTELEISRRTDFPMERQVNWLPGWTSFIMQQPALFGCIPGRGGGVILTVQEERKIETLFLSVLLLSVSSSRERQAAMQPKERGDKRGATR